MTAPTGPPGPALRRGVAWIVRDARRDGLSRRTTWAVFAGPVVGWVVLAVLFVAARPLFYLVQQEDHVVEWAQFALCAFTAVTAALVARRTGRGAPAVTVLLVLVALGTLFLAGEEISWGQRVVGLETPSGLAAANQQAETNLHNITVGLDLQTLFKVASVGLGLVGLLGIVVVRLRGRGPTWARLLAPPAATAPGFLGIVGYWGLVLATGGDVAPLLRFQEWVECALYISLAASVVAVGLRVGSPAAVRRSVRRWGIAVVVVTVVFAAVTPFSGVAPGNV